MLASSAGVIGSRITAYLGSLLVVVVSARELGTNGRGALVLIMTLSTLATIVVSFGLPIAGRLLLVADDDPVLVSQYLGLSVFLTAILAALAPVLSAWFLPLTSVEPGVSTLVLIGVLTALNGFTYLAVPAIAAFGHVLASNNWDGSAYAAQGCLCVVAALLTDISLNGFIVLLVVGQAIPVVGTVVSLRRAGHSVRPVIAGRAWRRLLRTGWPSLSTVLSENVTFRVDRLVLGVLATPSAVGIYSVGATAAQIIRLIPWSVNQLLFYEVVVGRLKSRQLRSLRLITIASMIFLCAVAALVAPYVVDAALGSAYADSVDAFRILLLAEVGLAWYLFDSTLLLGSHQVKRAAVAAAFGVVLILITDWLLIGAYGITGAAIASVVTYWSMAAVVRGLLAGARRRKLVRLGDPESDMALEAEAPAPPLTET